MRAKEERYDFSSLWKETKNQERGLQGWGQTLLVDRARVFRSCVLVLLHSNSGTLNQSSCLPGHLQCPLLKDASIFLMLSLQLSSVQCASQ